METDGPQHAGIALLRLPDGSAVLMSWARIDDAFDDHPKVLALLEHEQGVAAVGLWSLCLTWAYRNTLKRGKVPGLIPASLPRRYAGPVARELTALLLTAPPGFKQGLWEPQPDGDLMIHDFSQYLPTDKTREARAEAGRKGAEARWRKGAGRDGNLPSGDGKDMAGDGRDEQSEGDPEPAGRTQPGKSQSNGTVPSEHGNLPSGLPFQDGKPIANDGSRAPARRAIPNGIAPVPVPDPVPPSAGADSAEPNPGPIVAAFIEGATAAGLKRQAAPIVARVGKQARQMLSESTYTAEELIASARRMGAGEWNDLGVQARKDDAAAKAVATDVVDRRTEADRSRFSRSMARAAARERSE